MNTKFYICRHCGNIIHTVTDSEAPVTCCGEAMELLVPNTVEASGEKHIPHLTLEDGSVFVNVGSVDHPMLPAHFIQWICVETKNNVQFRYLQPEEAPNASFSIDDEAGLKIYAYCNLHGLWLTEVESNTP